MVKVIGKFDTHKSREPLQIPIGPCNVVVPDVASQSRNIAFATGWYPDE